MIYVPFNWHSGCAHFLWFAFTYGVTYEFFKADDICARCVVLMKSIVLWAHICAFVMNIYNFVNFSHFTFCPDRRAFCIRFRTVLLCSTEQMVATPLESANLPLKQPVCFSCVCSSLNNEVKTSLNFKDVLLFHICLLKIRRKFHDVLFEQRSLAVWIQLRCKLLQLDYLFGCSVYINSPFEKN